MKRTGLLFLVIVLSVSLMPWGVPAAAAEDGNAGSMTFTLYAGEYTITKDETGLDVIQMEGFSSDTLPGDPMLPHKVYNIAVPPDIVWSSLKLNIVSAQTGLLEGTYDMKPAGPILPGSDDGQIDESGEEEDIVNGKNMEVYGTDADFPESYVKLLPYSQMRKWKFTKVDFTPFQYNPVSKELTLIESVTIQISYEQSAMEAQAGLMSDEAMDDVARQMLLNYDVAKSWYQSDIRTEAQASPSYDYVIITTSAIVSGSAKLNAFKAHKESQGHSVLVVTQGTWGAVTGQAPNHKAEKIRKWLINEWEDYGIEYVLLIGDPHPYESGEGEGDVPMKMCYPGRNQTQLTLLPAPTDHFYADLTGNWDIDGDQYYGEWGGSPNGDFPRPGGVEFAPEVYVGRIPVYAAAYTTLDDILQKIIDYETGTAIGWRKNALLPMGFQYCHSQSGDTGPPYDGAQLGEQMRDDYLTGAGYTAWRMYQQGSGPCGNNSIYTSEENLRGGTGTGALRPRWAAGDYGVVCWWAHGGQTSAGIGYGPENGGCPLCKDGTLFQSSWNTFLDDNHPSFTYQCSCQNGWPENSDNLQYAILKHGGVGTVSATRNSWFQYTQTSFPNGMTNASIGYEYVKRLVPPLSQAAGEALCNTKANVTPSHQAWLANWYVFNLYGDPTTSLTSSGAAPSADIAFSSHRGGNRDIYVMNADGSNQINLTNNSRNNYEPAWSPDGNKIAFRTWPVGNYEVYVMDADGSNQINLTNNSASDYHPAWSPDGNKIAFETWRDGNYEVYVMDADGGNQINLTNSSASDYEPAWSPDGSRIAFRTMRGGNYEVYVMNADGSNQINVTNNSASDYEPAWSPDGSRIAFSSYRGGNREIYVMNADGSNQINLTNDSASDYEPAWSPDGSRIAFRSLRGGNYEIYVMNADGSGQINLTNDSASDYDPAWAPAAPSPPTLNSPADDAYVPGDSVTFQWQPVAGATTYWLLVDKAEEWGSPWFFYDEVGAALSSIVPGFPDDGTTYRWRVWAANAAGRGPGSAIWDFTNEAAAPSSAPTLVSPTDDANASGTSVTFEWEAVEGATTYWLLVDKAEEWGSPWFFYDEVGAALSSIVPGFPDDGTTFRWRVWGANAAGRGPGSAIWDFTNGTAAAPPPSSAPTLVSPADDAHVPGDSVTFEWEAVAGATTYWLLVDKAEEWGPPWFFYDEVGAALSSVVPGFPDDGTTFRWRVWGANAAGYGPGSAIWDFTNTAAAPPPSSAPTLNSPADDAHVPGTSVTFEWEAVAGATTYWLLVDKAEEWGSPWFFYDEVGAALSSIVPGFPDDGTTFRWRVWGANAAGRGPGSAIWDFTNEAAAFQKWAVIAGVSDYQYINDLNYCDDDAQDIYNTLIAAGWQAGNIRLRKDSHATKATIHNDINWMKNNAGSQDICLFSFSGHGDNGIDIAPTDEVDGLDEYLCPYNSLTFSYDNDIRDDELDAWMSPIAGKKVVMIDTCFSGGFIKSPDFTVRAKPGTPPTELVDGFAKDINKSGFVVLTASDDDELSSENGALQNGIFTYYLVEGLAGPADTGTDGVSAEEAFAYAEPRVQTYTVNTQNPQLYDGITGEVILTPP